MFINLKYNIKLMAKKKSAFERLEGEIITETENYVKGRFKRNMLKLGEVSLAFLAGFLLITVGMVELIAVYFPILEGGFNYLLMGILFLLVGILLKI